MGHPISRQRPERSEFPARVPPAGRFPWVDHLKALGILLVVAGHCRLSQEQHRWIYAFHMPLFFMLSGFLLSPGAFAVSARSFFMRRVWKLLKLYGWFGLLGAAVYCYIFRHDQPLAVAAAGRLASLGYASASTHTAADLYPMALWFFPGLISGLLITFALWRIPGRWARAAALTAVVGGGLLMQDRALPWELESGCLAAGCLALGHGARLADWNGFRQWAQRRRAWPVAVAALLLGSYLAILNTTGLDLGMARIGNPLLAIPACGLLLLAVTLCAMKLPAWQVSGAVAAATIVIFPTHQLIFPYLDRVALKLGVLGTGLADAPAWYGWAKAGAIVVATTVVQVGYLRTKQAWVHRARAAKDL